MSQFEYIAIPVSLIMTFGLARLLSGFPYLLTGKRTFWVHTLWCGTAIVNFLFFWWGFWNARHFEDWTLGSYLLTLAYPAMCYVGATILMPTDAAAQTDWHAYFFNVRKPLLAVAAMGSAINLPSVMLFGSVPLTGAALLTTIFVGLYIVGFLVASERVQKVIVIANAALVLVLYAPAIYRPFDLQ
jgi:hypothetical protein